MNAGIVACGAIATHIANIVEREKLEVTIYPLPPLLHNQPKQIAAEVDAKLNEVKSRHEVLAVAYADCGTYGELDQVIKKHGISRLAGSHCYDVFAGSKKIEALTTTGTYFLTDFLVKSFHRSVVVELGLDRYPELRDDYFKHYSKVVWLAQNPTEELKIAAQTAADILDLPLQIDVVGESGLLDQIKGLLNHIR